MSLVPPIILSILLHISFLVFFWQRQEQKPILPINRGNVTRPISFSLWSKQGVTQKKKQPKQKQSNTEKQTNQKPSVQGNITQEISRFKNSLQYPETAIEQGLESECTWEVEINPEGKAQNVRTLKPCLYNIFEREFRKSIRTWKFALQPGTRLQIPVSFILEK
ncbi:MAG: TonB family protein [Spirochaetota bacterium]